MHSNALLLMVVGRTVVAAPTGFLWPESNDHVHIHTFYTHSARVHTHVNTYAEADTRTCTRANAKASMDSLRNVPGMLAFHGFV